MAYEHKDGTFTLFKNDKGGIESRPDYTGEGKDLDGNPIRVAAWIKRGNSTFMSCTIQPKDDRKVPKAAPKPAPKKAGSMDDLESDVPF